VINHNQFVVISVIINIHVYPMCSLFMNISEFILNSLTIYLKRIDVISRDIILNSIKTLFFIILEISVHENLNQNDSVFLESSGVRQTDKQTD